jgi:hypothetical protein
VTNIQLGVDGHIHLPAVVLASQGWSEGTVLIAVDAQPCGLLLVSPSQAEELVRHSKNERRILASIDRLEAGHGIERELLE